MHTLSPKARCNIRCGASNSIVNNYSSLSANQRHQVDVYLETLLDWNSRMNLTAVTDLQEMYDRHINDSLALLPSLDAKCNREGPAATTTTLMDVGSGGGLPGLILAIARPTWQVSLLDSLQKRCKFLEAAIEATGVSNVTIVCARAEDAGHMESLREQYDLVVARAVAEMRVLAELCLPLCKVNGYWVAAKGADPVQEVDAAKKAITTLGGALLNIENVESQSPVGQRTAVLIKKITATPKQYPRKPGIPKKMPL